MAKHRYISERLNKHTYIKGEFKGKYVGDLDKGKSDPDHERFFDLEITEGDITTSQDDIKLWPGTKQSPEFADAPTFPVSLIGDMRVTLRYLDGSFKYFKLKIQELKLVNCRLTKQHHEGNKVFGVIEGDICGYLLHYDTIVREIIEEKEPFTIENEIIEEPPTSPTPPNPPVDRAVYDPLKKPFVLSFFSFLSKLMMLVGIFIILKHPWLLILFLLMSLLSFSHPYNWLSNTFGLRLSNNFATWLFTLLLGITAYCLVAEYLAGRGSYGRIAEKTYSPVKGTPKNSSHVVDSFNKHFDAAKSLAQNDQIDLALREIQRAKAFAGTREKGMIDSEVAKIHNSQAEELIRSGKDNEAIKIYSTLLSENPSNVEYLYKKAKCYISIGKIKDAVNDLKQAIDLGDKPSKLLHDKINPIKKRIAYYVTRCCDGTTSDAKGSGACSHHGGVCNWNDPVYEEYREYQ